MAPKNAVPSSLRQAADAIRASRGHALQLRSVFDQSLIPMVMVDNERRYEDVNPAARLLSRMSMEEARGRRLGRFAGPQEAAEIDRAWAELMRQGGVSGEFHLTFPDGSKLWIYYAAIANALPGRHLIVALPSEWPGDELPDVQPGTEGGSSRLSNRQLEVLRLVAVGASAGQIASELSISEATVRTHVKHILQRLGAHNRAHAVAMAMTQGLLADNPSNST